MTKTVLHQDSAGILIRKVHPVSKQFYINLYPIDVSLGFTHVCQKLYEQDLYICKFQRGIPTNISFDESGGNLRISIIMCNYWLLERLCGHRVLLAGSSCNLIYEQLQRINDPAEQARLSLPFDIPPGCLPNPWNIQRRNVNEFCSWECRNNSPWGGRRCGTRDASYGPGSERIGVGWRN